MAATGSGTSLRWLTAFALLAALSCAPALAAERAMDVSASSITVRVWKTGLLSAFAHNHEISAPVAEGSVNEATAGSVRFRVDARKMTVLDPESPQSTRNTIQGNMLSEEVLDAQKYPDIVFQSTEVRAGGGSDYTVRGNLTLHGQTHVVDVKVHLAAPGKYTGAAKVKQTDYGITPISIGGGAVKVKDEVDIEFVIVLKPAA